MLTLEAVWDHSPLSMFLRLFGPLASDLPIGDVLKNTTIVI